MNTQNRRSVNLPTEAYEELSYLQAEIRLILKAQNVDKVLSKTGMTKVLKTLIKNADAKALAALLK